MIEFDVKEFSREMDKILKFSFTSNKKLVYENARRVLKIIVSKTPHKEGHARAGWYPAWVGLGLVGSPMTSQPFGRHQVKRGRQVFVYISDGEFIDNTNDRDDPHIIFKNKTVVLTAAGVVREDFKRRRSRGERITKEERERVKGKRSKVAYLYLIEKGLLKGDNGQPVSQENKGFFSTTFKKVRFRF